MQKIIMINLGSISMNKEPEKKYQITIKLSKLLNKKMEQIIWENKSKKLNQDTEPY